MQLFVIEEWQHKPWKTWTDDEQVIEVKDNDALIFHEIATPVPQLRQRSYGKSAPLPTPITTEAVPVILPVVQSAPIKQNFVKKFTAFKSAPDLFGSALILSLAPEETTSLDLIYRALIVRYAAISHKGAEMLETLQGALDLDGGSTELPSMDVDSPAEQPIASTSATLILDPTVFPPSPPPESNSAPRPKRHNPLFIIKVSKVTQARVPTAVDAFSKEVVNLETRLPVSTSPTSDIFPDATSTSLPGSFNTLRSDDKEQVSANSASTETTELDIPRVIVPLVRAGDFLTTEWTAGALQYFFGEDGSVGWGELTDMIDPDIVAAKDLKGKKKTISIVDCLAEFTKEERLGEDDTWYCPDCKKHQQATKKVEIWKVPDVLVFNLKRFSASRYSRDKVEDLVEFPIDGFNLEPYVEGDKVERRLALSKGDGNSDEPDSLIYDLYAVDNHYGGLGGGHYTAYAKNHESGKWYDYDDVGCLSLFYFTLFSLDTDRGSFCKTESCIRDQS
jgi:ubiquitin carboxyl-terminal hydrolase 4/11/15